MGNSKSRQIALIVVGLGAVLLATGVVLGFVPFDSICGSAFFGLERTSTNPLDQSICTANHAGLVPGSIILMLLGALAVIVGGIVAALDRSTDSTAHGSLSVELRRLAELRAAGQLTDVEYAAAKAKLLGA